MNSSPRKPISERCALPNGKRGPNGDQLRGEEFRREGASAESGREDRGPERRRMFLLRRRHRPRSSEPWRSSESTRPRRHRRGSPAGCRRRPRAVGSKPGRPRELGRNRRENGAPRAATAADARSRHKRRPSAPLRPARAGRSTTPHRHHEASSKQKPRDAPRPCQTTEAFECGTEARAARPDEAEL